MTNQHILVINCGSSSLKFALISGRTEARLITGLAERLGSPEATLSWKTPTQSGEQTIARAGHQRAMEQIMALLEAQQLLDEPLTAVGHRVVHGGEKFSASTIITAEVLAAIEACNSLAPLHNPANVLGIKTAQTLFPDTPQVAVFDTAFHQTLPSHAYLYAIPYELYEEQAVRRYGFHGTSHRYVTQKAAELLDQPYNELALISAHLGNGCSATAVLDGRSIDTTLGLTPLEGLVMGTRSGDVDPSLHQFLRDTVGYDLDQTTTMLNKQSGLLGLSGLSNDMRTLIEAAANGHERAQIALNVFVYRLAKALGALAVPLGRIDALIFTGGIGEHAALIRQWVVEQLTIFGFELDKSLNKIHGQGNNGIITAPNSPVAMVIPTDEEVMIARDSLAAIQL